VQNQSSEPESLKSVVTQAKEQHLQANEKTGNLASLEGEVSGPGNAIENLNKNKQYYEEFEITMEDIEKLEEKIEEIEDYVGVANLNGDLDFLTKNEIEKLDAKCMRLDDFMKVIDDKNFLMNDLHPKFEQLENFLKQGNKFTS